MSLIDRLMRSTAASGEGPSVHRSVHRERGHEVVRTVWPIAARARRPAVLGFALEGVMLPGEDELDASLSVLCRHCAHSLGRTGTSLFIDLETTGLPGAGAIPFVVGMAYRSGDEGNEGEAYVVEQWCLERLSAEAEMLEAIGEFLRRIEATHLLSFNGASFDVPLLRRRFAIYALDDPFVEVEMTHVDLLHVARRLWRDRFCDCRLSTLERELLALRREGDMPGHLIPEAFWDWLRAPEDPACMRRLAAVRVHNQVDLVALPALAWRLARAIERPRDPAERLRAARHLHELGDDARALALLWPWFTEEHRASDSRRSAGILAAQLMRRAGRCEEAASLWESLRRAFPGDPQVHEALAKDLEHRQRDPVEALAVASGSNLPCSRRLERLRRKVDRLDVMGRA